MCPEAQDEPAGSFTDEHFDPELVGDGESLAIFPIRRNRRASEGKSP
jgi:hypothetical protein